MLVNVAFIKTVTEIIHLVKSLWNKKPYAETGQERYLVGKIRFALNVKSISRNNMLNVHICKGLMNAPTEGLTQRNFRTAVCDFCSKNKADIGFGVELFRSLGDKNFCSAHGRQVKCGSTFCINSAVIGYLIAAVKDITCIFKFKHTAESKAAVLFSL